MEILHTDFYERLQRELRMITSSPGFSVKFSEPFLGIMHERSVDAWEAGRMRTDEFMALRGKLRRLGMKELWY